MNILNKDKQARCIVPSKKEIFKIEGVFYYNEGSRAWSKIIFGRDMINECNDLADIKSRFGYILEYPKTEEARKKFIKSLLNAEKWPFFFWINRLTDN